MKQDCDPKDIAIKSFFLGPQSENASWLEKEWGALLQHWMTWRRAYFPADGRSISPDDQNRDEYKEVQLRLHKGLRDLMSRFEGETPTFTPRYVGHMMSEITLPAILGHVVALLHNPNNTSKDVAKVGSAIEREAIAGLAHMLGFDDSEARGHFTSGGTVANFEAVWRARYRMDHWVALSTALAARGAVDREQFFNLVHLGWGQFKAKVKEHNLQEEEIKRFSFVAGGVWGFQPDFAKAWGFNFSGPVVLVPGNKHFSWPKAISIFGLGDSALWPVELNEEGRLDIVDLKRKIAQAEKEHRPIMMVVSVAGTTELGEVDPVHEVQDVLDELREQRGLHIWHHVDAAYGAYYCSMLDRGFVDGQLAPNIIESFRGISRVDSVTVDPHKLGYVPYSCGAIVVRDMERYRVRSFAAPYLIRPEENAWAYTLEGSRSAAGATATWMSNHSIGLNSEGYGRILEKGIQARNELLSILERDLPEAIVLKPHDLNIVCLSLGTPGSRLSELNRRTEAVFHRILAGPEFSVSKTILGRENYGRLIEKVMRSRNIQMDDNCLYLLRFVMMNPFVVSRETNTKFLQELVTLLREA